MSNSEGLSRTVIFIILGFSIGCAIVCGYLGFAFFESTDVFEKINLVKPQIAESDFMVKTRDESLNLIESYKVDRFGNTQITDRERFKPNSEVKISFETVDSFYKEEKKSAIKKIKCERYQTKEAKEDLILRIDKAIKLVRKYEDHDIWTRKAFVKDDVIYISAMYNVNISCPWYLFRYNEKNDSVVPLCSFADEEILDIRV